MDKTAGFQISLQDENVSVETKSIPEELGEPTTDKFDLKIQKEGSSEYLYNGKYTSQTIAASAGTYTISASYGTNPVLALDDPYYFGEEADVIINDGEKKSVTLKCKVANALASVLYDDESQFSEMFSEYGVEIKVESNSVLLKNGTKESAYYRANSKPIFTFKGTIKDNGKKVESVLENEELSKAEYFSAAQHCKLTLSLKPATSGLIPTISKVEATTVTINETIPMEWLPAPKVSSTGFDENKVLMYYETAKISNASIDFDLASALQDLEFSLNFQDENLAKLNKNYKLSEITVEEQTAIRNIGINLPAIGGSSPQIEFTSDFYALLRADNEEVVENSISINSVTANNRTNKDENPIVYTIKTCKPEFSVSVLPGNIWTKEFTAEEITVSEGKGDLETLKDGGIKYQYSSDGGTLWKDFNDSSRQYFESCPSNKSYMIRAIYRDAIVSEPVNIDLETPVQLPNSGMEEWSTKELGSWGWINKTRYYGFYPYKDGSSDYFWATNNERSQDGNIILAQGDKTCFSPCVSYSESIKYKDTCSALIYTSGHGGGYASTGDIIYEEGAFAGSLFIGTYSWNRDNGETITKGHTFSSRPTVLKFWYNYVPKNTDTFQAYVELKNGEELVGTGTFTSSSSNGGWAEATVNIEYVDQPKKATSIYVQFLSTIKTSFSESDFDKNKGITFPVMGSWNAHIGSMLYIDDISLIYDK